MNLGDLEKIRRIEPMQEPVPGRKSNPVKAPEKSPSKKPVKV